MIQSNTIIQAKTLNAEIINFRFWIANTNSSWLRETFEALLHEADFNILNFNEHHFPVQGYTSFWLLAESHLAIHSFPNEKWSYIELSSCNSKKSKLFKSKVEALTQEIKYEEVTKTTPFI